MMNRKTRGLMGHVASLVLLAAVSAYAGGPRAFVLDSEGSSVVALDMASGAVLAKASVQGRPTHLLRSPDGRRLVVVEAGPGKTTMRFGFHPTGKASATVIDAASLSVVSRADLCWNVMDAESTHLFSADGKRLTVFCSGYRSQKAEETLPAEIVNIDLESGHVSGRVALDRRFETVLPLQDGQTVVVHLGWEAPKNAPPVPAEVAFIDLTGPRVVARLKLGGLPRPPLLSPDGKDLVFFSPRMLSKKEPAVPAGLQFVDVGSREIAATRVVEGGPSELAFSSDGRFLYLLEKGKPDRKPEKNVSGRIQVYSMETRDLEVNLEAGTAPRGFIADGEGQQVLVLSEGAPSVEKGEPEGELRVLRGGDVAATLKVAAEPAFLRISPDRARLYVVGGRALSHVDLPNLRRIADTPLKPAGVNILAANTPSHAVDELAVSDDGRRGFALYQGSSRLSVLDLESQKLIDEVTTGRGGKKFAKFMGAFALSVAMTAASQNAAMASGSPYYLYDVYSFQVAAPNTSLALRPDGKFAYALNSQTSDVTIVEADTGKIIDKVPGGGQVLELFTGGAMLAVRDKDALRFIDTATQKKGEELTFPGSSSVSLAFSSDGAHAIAAGGTAVYSLDGVSGKVRARHADFKHAESITVEDTPRREEAPRKEEKGPTAEPEPEPQAPDVVVEPQ
jgi:DNA-binding beta-propeller fold protein YncE